MSRTESVHQDLRDLLDELPVNHFTLRGFGPLVAAAVLVLLVVALMPSISGEHLVPAEPMPVTTVTAAPQAAG